MGVWKEFRFDEFVQVNPKVTFSTKENIPFVEMKDIDSSNKICTNSSFRNLSGGSRFENGDTLFARITPCLENGKIAQVRNLPGGKGLGSTEFHVLRGRPNISDSDFVYYLSRWKEVRDFAEINLHGTSGRQRFPAEAFKELVLNLPGITEQQSIAEILSSLDDKIDLLFRQNKTLEQMAETLFRQWFVEEEKDEWVETAIDQVALINPETISKKFEFTRIEYLDTGSITKGSIDSFLEVDLSEAPSRAQRRVIDNDIVFSLVRPNQCHYGILNGTKPNTIVSTGFCVIRANKISPYFIYYLLTNQTNVEYLHSIAEGSTSTYPSLRPEDIAKFTFNLPPENKCNAFHEHVSSYWHKIFANQRQIKKIESMRDILLPKLMNGTVRVSNN